MDIPARADWIVTETEALAVEGVRHHFGRTLALDDAHCRVRAGTVHALLGENGAGKTTLMRIAFGMLVPESGVLRVRGRPVRFRSSADAITNGVGMVHQHFSLVPALTGAENVALGGSGRLRQSRVAERMREIELTSGLAVDPSAYARDLSVGAQQRLEIIKALAHDARIVILDEPTAVLSPDEGAELMRWLSRFAGTGGTAILITHKLREALDIADDVTVLRRGRTVLSASRASLSEADVVAALTGESVTDRAGPARHYATVRTSSSSESSGDPRGHEAVLALEDVTVVDPRGVTRLRSASVSVRAGEVIGVLGVEESGVRELLRTLAGRLLPTEGRVKRPARVGFIPEDRLNDALIPELSLTENLALADAGSLRGMVNWTEMRQRTVSLIERFDVRSATPSVKASTLSGGNQQKFVVGREHIVASLALVAENPTRGLDLRASARVLEELVSLARDRSTAVVFHSSDMDEVLSIATRVVVCFNGRVREVTAPVDIDDLTPYTRAMTGSG